MRGAGHHSLLARGQAAVSLEEIIWAIAESGWMFSFAMARTLGLRGRPSLAGTVPRCPAMAREGLD
eukprot:5302720-Heterocapsa_arctica.AAC.1